jgi:hypothetical protein
VYGWCGEAVLPSHLAGVAAVFQVKRFVASRIKDAKHAGYNILDCDFWAAAVHLPGHWVLAWWDLDLGRVTIYDSMIADTHVAGSGKVRKTRVFTSYGQYVTTVVPCM